MRLSHIVVIQKGMIKNIRTFALDEDLLDPNIDAMEEFEKAILALCPHISRKKLMNAMHGDLHYRHNETSISMVFSDVENMQI